MAHFLLSDHLSLYTYITIFCEIHFERKNVKIAIHLTCQIIHFSLFFTEPLQVVTLQQGCLNNE